MPFRPLLSGPARLEHARVLRREYENGATVRQLADAYRHSYGCTHDLLREAETVFRSRGYSRRTTTEGTTR